jgi:hypothetical protein
MLVVDPSAGTAIVEEDMTSKAGGDRRVIGRRVLGGP